MAACEEGLEAVVRVLRAGEPVVLPTDTVYGLGVAVAHAEGPGALFAAKGRPEGKPVAWLVGAPEDLGRYGRDVPACAWELAQGGWPGPLTLVVRASDEVPQPFRSTDGSIGLRMPASPDALALIEALGCPIAATSANFSGAPPAARFDDIDLRLLEAAGATLRATAPSSGRASAVWDCTSAVPKRLR